MQVTILVLITSVISTEIRFDKTHGILYQPTSKINIFTEVRKTYLNVLIRSPRSILRSAIRDKNCGWTNQNIITKKSFPLKTYKIETTIDKRTCDYYLGVFDRTIRATIANNIVTYKHENRRIARSPMTLAFVPILIGATGFFSYAAGQSAHDESKRRMEHEERERIASIHSALELNAHNIASVAEYMQRQNVGLATFAPLEAPEGILANLEHSFLSERGLAEFVIDFSQNMANKVIDQMVALTNNRLPTDINFINAMRAACLSQQITQDDDTKEHCREFALHTTRWDTSLRFAGVGLVNATDNTDDIDDVLLSLSVDIPVFEFSGAGYRTHNLGFFTSPHVRQMLEVPKFIVIYPNGKARGMVKSRCLHFNNGFACQNDLLEPHPCVEQSFLNMTTTACSPTRVDPSKCGLWQTNSIIAFSLPKPSEIEFFHKEPNKRVDAIDVFNKTSNAAAVHCGDRTMKIRPKRDDGIFNVTLTYLSPERISVDDSFEKFADSLQKHSEHIRNQNATIHTNAMDTRQLIEDFRTHVHDNFAAAEAKITMWIHGIVASVGSVTFLLIIAFVVGCIIYRKFTSYTQPAPVILGLSPPPQRTQRQDQDHRARAENSSV